MLGKNKQSGATADTLIASSTLAEGKLHCENNLRVEGVFRGEITCSGDVIIGKQGAAYSSINARIVQIAGVVHGDVMASTQITVAATGQLFGNAIAPSLVVALGGSINGSIFMQDEEDIVEERRAKTNISPIIEAEPHSTQDDRRYA